MVNEGLAFLLELLALAVLAYWGFEVGEGVVLKIVLGVGAPVLAAIVWSLCAAPRATFGLPQAAVLVVKVLWFGAPVAALLTTGHPVLSGVLAVVVAANLAYVTMTRKASPRHSGPR